MYSSLGRHPISQVIFFWPSQEPLLPAEIKNAAFPPHQKNEKLGMESEFKMCGHKNKWIIPSAYSNPLISSYNLTSPIRELKGKLMSFLENTCKVIRNHFYVREFFKRQRANQLWSGSTWLLTLFGLMRNTHKPSISRQW